jgi:hypothetical protein
MTTAGACQGDSCWTDANLDSVVQANELTGMPGVSSSRFDLTTGVLTPAGNIVDESAKLGRTREVTAGISHELIPNLAIGVDGIYRRYDNGTAGYTIGYQPGAAGFPLSQIYTGPLSYTDPVSGNTGNYYVICDGCMRPSGLGSITVTDPDYETYKGVDLTLNKRYSDRWQLNIALTLQNSAFTYAEGSNNWNNPTGREYVEGINNVSSYVFKVNGSYDLPYGVTASTNFNWNQGGRRVLSMNGPGRVYGGVNSSGADTTITYNTLKFQSDDSVRYDPLKIWDMGLQKTFTFRGGQNRVKLMFDAFNILNNNSVRGFSSNNINSSVYTRVSSIVPPRIFRVGATINF